MTTATYKQSAATASYLTQGCSSVALPSPNIVGGHYAIYDGSTGATQHTRTITGSDTFAASHVILALWHSGGFPDGNYWEAGDWICRLNVSQANSSISWTSVHICAQRGTTWTTIASNTSVATPCFPVGTKSVTLTTESPSDFTSAGSQTIYWIYGFQKTTTAEQTFKYKSNKNLATPIVAKAFVPTASFASASIGPTWSGSLDVSVPTATFGSAALAQEWSADTATVSVPVNALSAALTETTVGYAPAFTEPRANIAAGVAARYNLQSGEADSASLSNGKAVRANASVAMEAQSALASGGPEAFSLGQD